MDYDARIGPEPNEWLETDEQIRLDAIERWFSEQFGLPVGASKIEVNSFLTVENQIALGQPPATHATLNRLTESGVDRLDAIWEIADVIDEMITCIVLEDKSFDATEFAKQLDTIDANALLADDLDPDFDLDFDPELLALADAQELELIPEFDPVARKCLEDFAVNHKGENVMPFRESVGFIYAVHACPELIMPSEWAEVMQGDAVFDSMDEAIAVHQARIALNNWVTECLQNELPPLPDDCQPVRDSNGQIEHSHGFSKWCAGGLIGHDWLVESWSAVLLEDSDEDQIIAMILIMLAYYSNREAALAAMPELIADSHSSEQLAKHFDDRILSSIVDYVAIGRSLERSVPNPQPDQSASSNKIGRNEPCPCGSGLKYKKCCANQRLH